MSGSGHPGLWTEPKYPGDTVRILMLHRDGEIGDIRIQQYTPTSACVACLLPGEQSCSPGDTPKTIPEKHTWHHNSFACDAIFDRYVQEAYEAGWQNYDPNNYHPNGA